ncbi:hypothetical protein QWZ10_07435 [Paracoccus cavernae]|uniref:Uncharacterized protein n=1 Tax=Paracoccus cavernae TaxID=1571207 RepID=A0ABT8D4J2_9RHOB|nr:hypothetical protein [Paracoccus cavernae]
MTNEVNTTAPIGATLGQRIQRILDARNQMAAAADEADKLEPYHDPDSFRPTPEATLEDVLKCISASDFPNAFGVTWQDDTDAMSLVMDEVMREIAKDIAPDYDPWPELDKKHLLLLIGDRSGSRDCPFRLYTSVRYHAHEPLTLSEKILAVRHREWLEKGLDKKLKKLEAAKKLLRDLGEVEAA